MTEPTFSSKSSPVGYRSSSWDRLGCTIWEAQKQGFFDRDMRALMDGDVVLEASIPKFVELMKTTAIPNHRLKMLQVF